MSELLEFPPHTLLAALQALFALSIGHAVADFPLQGEYLATGKNWRLLKRLQDPARPEHIWFTCMAAHCLVHAGAVWLITGSSLFAAIELVLHWSIDVAKCSGKTTFNQDQALHILCKVGYVCAAYAGLA
jgi:hypothetical protein